MGELLDYSLNRAHSLWQQWLISIQFISSAAKEHSHSKPGTRPHHSFPVTSSASEAFQIKNTCFWLQMSKSYLNRLSFQSKTPAITGWCVYLGKVIRVTFPALSPDWILKLIKTLANKSYLLSPPLFSPPSPPILPCHHHPPLYLLSPPSSLLAHVPGWYF